VLEAVKGVSKQKPESVFGKRSEGRGLAKSSESSSSAGRGEGGGIGGIASSLMLFGPR
jgi:hypothetical protein